MAKKKGGDKFAEMTYVITSAQGMQNPYSARMYGRDTSKGAPNIPLIKNMENYANWHNAEIQIHCMAGANVNEVELHPFFHDRDDIYVESDAKRRNAQNRVKEAAKREAWQRRAGGWEDRQRQKYERAMEKFDETSATEPVPVGSFPHEMPMHYFWEQIPQTDWPLAGKRLNSNIRTTNIPIKPQNKNPLSGKNFLTKEYGGNSVVIASPKKMMRPVAKGASGDYPHMLITTGACTKPNYNFGDLGFIAKKDHSYGFAVVNVLDDKIYLPRIVPAQANGTFIDLGVKYAKGKDPERAVVSALEVADSHFLEINPKINKVNMEMMQYLRPESTFLNDVFAALSVSVHEIGSPIRKARLHRAKLNNLEKELFLTGEYIEKKANLAAKWGGDVYIKWSNHDDMLYRWLNKEGYRNDLENQLTAFRILARDPGKGDCFEKAVKLFYDIPENVVFLRPGEDVSKQGYFLSSHGHQGVNGSRGSLKGLEDVYKKVIVGHGHKLEVLKDAISVGTSTNVLDYQLGNPSTQMAGNAAVYRGGLAQAIPVIKSRWAPDSVLKFLKKN